MGRWGGRDSPHKQVKDGGPGSGPKTLAGITRASKKDRHEQLIKEMEKNKKETGHAVPAWAPKEEKRS